LTWRGRAPGDLSPAWNRGRAFTCVVTMDQVTIDLIKEVTIDLERASAR